MNVDRRAQGAFGRILPTFVTTRLYDLAVPVVFRYRAFRFFFYSNEGTPREPMHVHAIGEGGEAKFWLRPLIRVASSDGLSARKLRELTSAVENNSELVERAWNEHFT